MSKGSPKEKRPPVISGIILLLLGLMMLFAEHTSLHQLWPLLIILAGLLLIVRYSFGQRKDAQPAPPNSAHSSPPPPPPPPAANR